MRKVLVIIVLIATAFSSCRLIGGKRVRGNGNVITQDRNVGNFSGVRSHGFFDVYLTSGPTNSVRIEAEENIQQHIQTHLEGNVLKIETEDGIWLKPRRDVKVYITSPSLNEVKVYGSGNITSQSKITNRDKMQLGIYGSGDIKADINAPVVEADISGSGNINLAGEVKEFDGEINGSGDIKAADLKAEDTKVSINGSGSANIFASVKLDIAVRGSGDVRYSGPAHVTSDIRGSGSVKKVD